MLTAHQLELDQDEPVDPTVAPGDIPHSSPPYMLWILGGYMWLFLHRPFEIWPWMGDLHIERLYMLGTLLAWSFSSERGWVSNRLSIAFSCLVIALVTSWAASPYPDLAQPVVEEYLKNAVVFVLVMSLVRDERQLRLIIKFFLIAMALYMAHSVKEFFNGRHEYRMGIIRMMGVDDTFSNPNAFAANLLCALPLTFPFWAEARQWRQKAALAGYTGLTVFCILMTGSRASMVGLLCLGFLKLLTSKNRIKVLLILAVSMPGGWFLLPTKKQERFLTLIDPKYGPENAKESAEFRSHALIDGARLWGESPATGFGPGTFGKAAGHGWQAHNLYAQTIGEVGTLGALALAGIVACFALNAYEVRIISSAHPLLTKCFARHVSEAVSLIVVLLLVLGCGGHNLYRYNWMWCGAFQAVALGCIKDRFVLLSDEQDLSQ
jgi:hypothetical protein